MATKSATLFFRASPELAAALEAQAEASGMTVSAYLRDLAERSEAWDDRDVELVRRLENNDDTALAELLGLNVSSLVHRFAQGCDYAAGLTLRLAAHGTDEQRSELICALVAAVTLMQRADPHCDDLASLTEMRRDRLALMAKGRGG